MAEKKDKRKNNDLQNKFVIKLKNLKIPKE